MSESLGKSSSKSCAPKFAECKTDNLVDVDLPIGKSGSFDAEFDLLESTLSELKDEHETTTISSNEDLNIEDGAKINFSFNNNNNTSDTTSVSKVVYKPEHNAAFCVSCQDPYSINNRPYCVHKYSLLTQHSKTISHQGDILVTQNNPENVSSHLDSNSNEPKSEIPNNCSTETINEPVLIANCDKTNNISDKNECDRSLSLSLKSLEVINRDPKCGVSLSLRSEELSQATKHSNEGCDFDTVSRKSNNIVDILRESNLKSFTELGIHETIVNSSDSCECLPEIPKVMGDTAESSGEFLGHPDESNNDITIGGESETKVSKICDSEHFQVEYENQESSGDPDGSNNDKTIVAESEKTNVSKILDSELVQVEYEDQENTTQSNEGECPKSLVTENTTPVKLNCEFEMTESQVSNEDKSDELIKKQEIYSSTPNVARKFQEDGCNQSDGEAPDFGLVSPLGVKCLKGKQNLKRKYTELQTIDEIDENNDSINEKKTKVVNETVTVPVLNSVDTSEAGTSSTIPCFETPARSLLNKWQPSCLSRNVSGASYIVLDECGEAEVEDCFSQGQDSLRVDEFEIACQSLSEIIKGPSNIETLEKYHSQIQLENQIDDEKFDEILNEITMILDLDDKTCLSVKSMDESTIIESDEVFHVQDAVKESVDALLSGTDKNCEPDNAGPLPENKKTDIEGSSYHPDNNIDDQSNDKNKDSRKLELIAEANESSNNNVAKDVKSMKDKPSASDEEDFLLNENVNTKDKPYEFFEFISTDPKENEDNYNPEWQKLGRLTSDEERYKAVRDRWRSLVPPDPNRNLTFRQWRVRNNKPPIRVSPLNNNHQLMNDNEKSQLCTAVFDSKITKTVQELEEGRVNICQQRLREFEKLCRIQDQEHQMALMRGFGRRQIVQLHNGHLAQCKEVKFRYDQELNRIKEMTEDKIRVLREASKEVLLFQKFYKGVGAKDDNEMYMTDIQVQELIETEDMLEQYKIFYK